MTEDLGKTQEQTYYVRNVDCENEVAKIERELGKQPGVRHVKVSSLTSKVMITFEPERVSSESIAKALSDLGFPLKENAENEAPEKLWQNKKVLFATGMLSPVTGASFTDDEPAITSPSVANDSPGRTMKMSPTLSSSTGISSSTPSRITRATFGTSFIKARTAARVFSSVYPSAASEIE